MTTSDAASPRRNLLAGYRVVVALLIFGSVVTEIATLVERDRFNPGNLFSFFTIEANLIAVVVLLLSAVSGGRSRALVMVRGASTLYMAITGIVFSVLLAGIEGAEFTAVPWDNTVLHFVGPVVVVLDWFIDLPRQRIAFRRAAVWLLYPIAYGAYSLVRGPVVGWYPYPFLDPGEHGYPTIFLTIAALTLFGAALTWVIIWFAGRRATSFDETDAR